MMKHRQKLYIALIALVTLPLALFIVKPMWSGAQANEDHDHEHAEQSSAAPSSEKDSHGDEGEGASESSSTLRLSDEQRRHAALQIAVAAPAMLDVTALLPGEIRLNEDRTAHIVPRVAGVVESAPVSLGQSVKKGQVLAVIASTAVSAMRAEFGAAVQRQALAKITLDRETALWREKISAEQDYLQAQAAYQEADIAVASARQKLTAYGIAASASGGHRFELKAPFNGTVLEKHVTQGELVPEDGNVYTIADLSSVWATFNASAADLAAVKLGAPATVTATALNVSSKGTISYVGNLVGESTRTTVARVTLPNPKGAWRPGLFVTVTVVAGRRQAPVTIDDDALQTIDGKTQVFVETADGFVARPVKIGTNDGNRVEIIEGLAAGERVVTTNSFVLKSELEKGSAEHGH